MKTNLARAVFAIAGLWGFLSLAPMLFMFQQIGVSDGRDVTHPGFYFGFLTAGLAWSAVYVAIAINPKGLRPMMLPATLGKAAYAAAMYLLFRQARTSAPDLVFGAVDGLLGSWFVVAYVLTKESGRSRAASA